MVVPQFHRRINIPGTRHALLKHAHGFESQCNSETAGSETGNIANHDRFLAQSCADFANKLHCIITSSFSDDNFNQPHQVNWIEKMHADHVLWTLRSFGDFGYRK